MIYFPNAKINLGLHITEKRADGYHNLETIFYPVGLSDILEIREAKRSSTTKISNSGIPVDTTPDNNLCMHAYRAVKEKYDIPPVNMHLHKIIPFGSGLGGGSSDAAHTLTGLNHLFRLRMKKSELMDLSEKIGADCAFFLENAPSYAWEKGNRIEPAPISLKGYYLLLIVPDIKISTKFAYQGVKPEKKPTSLKELIQKLPIEKWHRYLFNDFEKHLFLEYPELDFIKKEIYKMDALYASLSGSGSSVFGIFRKQPVLTEPLKKYWNWQEKFEN
jgi:4-diphosphocytidyl-2-C-methyl-D-erythritol kinase